MGDPNWFFSTIAQSAAAIVGLMGAVLGARTLEHIAEARVTKAVLESELRNHRKTLCQRVGHFKLFINYL